MNLWQTVDGNALNEITGSEISDAEKKYVEVPTNLHRVDLHHQLLGLAMGQEVVGCTCYHGEVKKYYWTFFFQIIQNKIN